MATHRSHEAQPVPRFGVLERWETGIRSSGTYAADAARLRLRFSMMFLKLVPMRVGKLAALAALAGVTACSGGSTGASPVPNTAFCGNDTQYALAIPQTGQTIPANTTATIEIVASGNNNQIYSSFKNFDLLLVPAYNNGSTAGQVATGPLSLTGANGAPAPFPSDYYYNGTLQTGLASGVLYNVYLNAYTTNCTPVGPIGQLAAQ